MGTRTAVWRSEARSIAAAVLVASMTATTPVLSQGAPPKAPAADAKDVPAPAVKGTAAATTTEAARLYEEGVHAAVAGQLDKARELLLASFKLDPTPKTAVNLGRTELKTTKYRDAAEHLSFFLRSEGVSPDDQQATEKMLAEAKAKIGTVTVRVDVADAEVLVDGRPVGKSPLAAPVFVEPGLRQFEARKEGHGRVGKPFDIVAGSAPAIDLSLAMPPGEQPTARATPPSAVRPTRPGPAPHAEGHPKKVLVYTGIAVSGALAFVGIGTAVGAALTEKVSGDDWERSNCTSANPKCRSDFDAADTRRVVLGNTAVWTFIGAAVVGGATAAYALLGHRLNPSSAPRNAVVVMPAGTGIIVKGNF